MKRFVVEFFDGTQKFYESDEYFVGDRFFLVGQEHNCVWISLNVIKSISIMTFEKPAQFDIEEDKE